MNAIIIININNESNNNYNNSNNNNNNNDDDDDSNNNNSNNNSNNRIEMRNSRIFTISLLRRKQPQHVRSSDYGAILYTSRATHRALITYSMSCATWYEGQLVLRLFFGGGGGGSFFVLFCFVFLLFVCLFFIFAFFVCLFVCYMLYLKKRFEMC